MAQAELRPYAASIRLGSSRSACWYSGDGVDEASRPLERQRKMHAGLREPGIQPHGLGELRTRPIDVAGITERHPDAVVRYGISRIERHGRSQRRERGRKVALREFGKTAGAMFAGGPSRCSSCRLWPAACRRRRAKYQDEQHE